MHQTTGENVKLYTKYGQSRDYIGYDELISFAPQAITMVYKIHNARMIIPAKR